MAVLLMRPQGRGSGSGRTVWRSFVQETGLRNGAYGADKFGFKDLAAVHWNLTDAALYEHAIANGEATIVAGGALCAETGVHTGRSPEGQAHRRRRADREHRLVGRQPQA